MDYSTSGVLVFPLSKEASQDTALAFSERNVTKLYLAMLRGHLSQNQLNVQVPIGTDSRPEFTKLKMATPEAEYCVKPRYAETTIKVLSRGYFQSDPVTKVLLTPLTGRRHQLRVHCHHIGHTIVGDYTYSDKTDTKPARMYLHAYKIKLPNAIEDLDINAGDPFEDMEDYKDIEVVHDCIS